MAVGVYRQPKQQQDSSWNGSQQTTTPTAPTSNTPGLGPTEPPKQEDAPAPPPQNQQPQQTGANVGHDGSFGGQSREQWRDAWMSSGNKSQSGTDQWMQQNGATKLANNGTFMTPYGEVLDLGIGYRSGNVTPGWTQTGGQQSYQQGYVPQGLGPSDTTWNGGGGGGGMMDPGMMSAFQQFLMQYQNPQQQQPQKTPTYNRNSPNNRYTMMQSRY